MSDPIFWAIVAVVATLSVFAFQYLWRRIDKRASARAYYEAIWNRASQLTPDQVMHSRSEKKFGFHKYYYPRPIDDKLGEMIDQGEHVVVIGKPLSGKTRSVFNALKNLSNPAVVTIPTLAVDNFPADIEISYNKKMVTREILLVDDIGKFLLKPNFSNLLRKFAKRGTIIVGTCWETETGFVQQKLEQEAGIRIVEYLKLDRITPEEASDVAEEAGKQIPETFDGNIGSIFLDIEEMKRRYVQLNDAGKIVLQSVKRLYQAGVYDGREEFGYMSILMIAGKYYEINENAPWWEKVMEQLAAQSFADVKKRSVHFEEAYLQYVVKGNFGGFEDFRRLVELFDDNPQALVGIAEKSYKQELPKQQKADSLKLVISACKQAISTWTLSTKPEQYATTHSNLGLAYSNLGQIEDKSSNYKAAIQAYKEVPRVFTREKFPQYYAQAQNNLGNSYATLAEVEDKSSNCKIAIEAYKNALQVFTFDDFRIDYASTQNNLGATYCSLAKVEDEVANIKLAIEAFTQALLIRTIEEFPMDYAMTQNNLGHAHQTLAHVEDITLNCQIAVKAYRKALLVLTYDGFPIKYAETIENIGVVYFMYAIAENRSENCPKAKDAFEESLRVYTELEMESNIENIQRGLKLLAGICQGDVESES